MRQYSDRELAEIYTSIISPFTRYVIKVGSNVISKTNTETGVKNLIEGRVEDICNQAAVLLSHERDISIVTSGAVAAGKAITGFSKREYGIGEKQALAAIGQAELVHVYSRFLRKSGIYAGQVLLSYDDLKKDTNSSNFKNAVDAIRRLNGIPIINENDPIAIEELELLGENGNEKSAGENDTLAVRVAKSLGAQTVFMLSTQPGFMNYSDSDHLDGIKFNVIEDPSEAERHILSSASTDGRGGMNAKLEAVREAREHGIYVVMLDGREEDAVLRTLSGEPLGTVFLPQKF